MFDSGTLWTDIEKIRNTGPLVHNITNFVVMNTTANALLAIGASPIMAHAPEEMEDLVGIVNALVLNIGTLRGPWIQSMKTAGALAKKRSLPIVLDPVGAGASRLRTDTALQLLEEVSPAILRGNSSEIMALAGQVGGTKGVDSTMASDAAANAADILAERFGCVVVVSGAVDLITDGTKNVRLTGGSPMLPRVTGMGCTASCLAGAFSAVNPSAFEAAVHAMAIMDVASELAQEQSQGPGTLQLHFLDALYALKRQELEVRFPMIAA
ncbi:MAG: hydroxyethylthiazole kinase [Desulfovibrionales bacterium]